MSAPWLVSLPQEALAASASIGSFWLYAGFTGLVLAMLALDLGVFHRKAHVVGFKEALGWSVVWVALALLFNAWLWATYGGQRGLEFLTGYLIEKSLAVDNIFVFLVVFSYFAVPAQYQHRVLFWGILGALVMRGVFIWLGAELLTRFHWMIYVFGGFLVLTGIKLALRNDEQMDPGRNPVVRLFRKWVPTTRRYHRDRFWVRRRGLWLATPLLLVLVLVEFTDVVFAVDSIPAIFAVTSDPFIVFTSNIFAILGLRSMYFLLAGVMHRFHLLKFGLAMVLVFVGTKMCLMGVYKIPTALSLGVVAAILAGSVVASLVWPKRTAEVLPHPGAPEPGRAGKSAGALRAEMAGRG
ncbi:MAG: TerC family protein [Planctomycetes bacterium]|nr:TerC family protein [Planctomycetota bacterium]